MSAMNMGRCSCPKPRLRRDLVRNKVHDDESLGEDMRHGGRHGNHLDNDERHNKKDDHHKEKELIGIDNTRIGKGVGARPINY